MATFRPTTVGTDYALPPMFTGLDALKGDFSIITGLENVNAKPDMAGDHASGTSGFITCTHANKSETDIKLGISVDQVAAQKIGMLTRLPSLQLGIDGGGGTGNCDSGYSCAYARNISWSTETTPLPKIVDPAKVFDQLFAGATAPGVSDAEAAKRRSYDKSVLDSVLAEATSLRLSLGRTDQVKLDQYLEGVRELERRIAAVSTNPAVACAAPARPAASTDFIVKLGLMTDLMVLAFPHLGITRGHHDISHHGNDPANIAMLAQIGLWEVGQLGVLMGKLKAIPDGADGATLLDNITIYWSSDISDGARHNHDDIPVLLAGHGGGALKPGRHIAYAKNTNTKMANLMLNILGTVGVTDTAFGDSTGPLTDI
jgi:hypothetical protein